VALRTCCLLVVGDGLMDFAASLDIASFWHFPGVLAGFRCVRGSVRSSWFWFWFAGSAGSPLVLYAAFPVPCWLCLPAPLCRYAVLPGFVDSRLQFYAFNVTHARIYYTFPRATVPAYLPAHAGSRRDSSHACLPACYLVLPFPRTRFAQPACHSALLLLVLPFVLSQRRVRVGLPRLSCGFLFWAGRLPALGSCLLPYESLPPDMLAVLPHYAVTPPRPTTWRVGNALLRFVTPPCLLVALHYSCVLPFPSSLLLPVLLLTR